MARAAIRTEPEVERLVGWKCLKGVGAPLARLRERRDGPNRDLHHDEYATLLPFYVLNARMSMIACAARAGG